MYEHLFVCMYVSHVSVSIVLGMRTTLLFGSKEKFNLCSIIKIRIDFVSASS